MKRLWFSGHDAKLGWRPVAWQGWLLVSAYGGWLMLLTVWLVWMLGQPRAVGDVFGPILVVGLYSMGVLGVAAVVLEICYRTGDAPRWFGRRRQ